MRREKENDIIGGFTTDSWKEWVSQGWLERLESEFGPLGERGRIIFENGWKLGFAASISVGRDMANEMMSQMDEVEKN